MEEEKVLTENEQKKEFLSSYQEAKKAVFRLDAQLEEIRINKISPSSMIGDGMPHSHNVTDLSEYMSKVDEIEREIKIAKYKRICEFQKVQKCIEAMSDEREKELLTYRYLRWWEWEKIAVKMGYSWQHIHKIHAKALKNFKMR